MATQTLSHTGIFADVDASTQYATVYSRDGKPIGTLQRRRVYAAGKEWKIFATDGLEIAEGNAPRLLMARLANHLAAMPAPFRTTKRAYLAACMSQSIKYLESCLAHPSPEWRPIHVALIRIAIRRKLAKGGF